MASPPPAASKSSVNTKQLKEHLQEQQEPFTLNIDLSERGYLVKCLSSNGRNGCCQTNLFKNLKIIRPMIVLSTRVVKSILYKLASANDSQELSNCCTDKAHQDEFQTAAEPYGFAQVKGMVTSCGASPTCIVEEQSLYSKSEASQTSSLDSLERQKAITDKTCQTKCAQDKYLNLMSMLNKLSSDKVHHIITRQEIPSCRNSTLTENCRGGNFIFAPFPWKLLGKSLMERYTLIGFKEGKGIIGPCSPRFQRNNHEFVNQRKPMFNLLEDNKTLRNRYNYIYWFIGVEKLGNLIRAEKIYSYKKNSRDLSNTLEEWNYSQKLQRKISFELGDIIMDEIVEETIHLLRQ
ncbi:hypothetical protein PTKIN_Ptkin02bG0164600 [Pterospermum kingtungense]